MLGGICAYAPRKLLRSVHASPGEAVEMGKAIKAKSLRGTHRGTIEYSQENTFEPAHRLRKATFNAGYQDNAIVRPSVEAVAPMDRQQLNRRTLNARQPIGVD